MKSLIIGRGEIGSALYRILEQNYDTYIRDKKDFPIKGIEVLHICFPYFEGFVEEVKKYVSQYKPKYTIIHSTIPLGTTRKCGNGIFHSPCMGIHPFLEEGIKTFTKYLSPPNEELKQYFNRVGIKIMMVEEPENTEALKLWETTEYGWFIILEKEIKKWCEKKGLDFNLIYTEANKNYNEGYKKLGLKNVVRPILRHQEGKIGGHCVIPNCEVLDSEIAKIILNFNKKY